MLATSKNIHHIRRIAQSVRRSQLVYETRARLQRALAWSSSARELRLDRARVRARRFTVTAHLAARPVVQSFVTRSCAARRESSALQSHLTSHPRQVAPLR